MTPPVTPITDLNHDASPAGRRNLCPLCESDELEYEFSIDHSPVSGCRKCGLLFLNPMPAEIPERGPFRDVYEVNVANAACRLNWLEKYVGASPGRLLLVGADATMVEDASKRGFDVFELSIDELERGSVAAAEIGRVQAVVLCCALETATDPASVLATVRRLLEPGGALMVVAPTIDSRTARLFRTNWWEFSRRNRFYFSADTLQCLLARMQFDQPIILREDSMVSIRYVREKLASLKAFRFAVLRLFLSLSPGFLSRRVFASLHTRTVMLVRPRAQATRPRVSIVMPVYNEVATFLEIMEAVVHKSLDGTDIEIIVVESNSTDGTRDLALRYQDHSRVRLILEERPSGKGHAVRRGLSAATGDVVLIQDADLEYDINDYDALIAPILRYERNFVIGSRHGQSGKLWKMREFNDAAGLAAYFNFGHLLFLWLFNVIYRQRLKDPFSMFKVFRRQCLYGVILECNRFDFDFELAIKLLRKGYAALELPVSYRARSFSAGKKVSAWRDPLTWVRALVKFRFSPLYGSWTM